MLKSTARVQSQRGLSLVELMVGIAIGLVVVAGAVVVTTSQLGDNRRLLLETQLQQDLRATADIITRELRRAGSTNMAQSAVWFPGSPGAQPNAFAQGVAPAAVAAAETTFSYRRGPGATGPYGFRLQGGVIQSQFPTAIVRWQDLTDAATMQVTNFTVTPQNDPPQQLPCPRRCADGTTDCWPTVTVRAMRVQIIARAVADPAVQRSIDSVVRLRNDWVRFNDPANPNAFCPA